MSIKKKFMRLVIRKAHSPIPIIVESKTITSKTFVR